MMFNEGDMIGSYRLVSLLGAGGMATVYKAYHPKLDRYVALKMMHSSFLSDPQFVARFEREAQIVARLEHPNIVPVHDFAEYDGQPFLVMKYIAGISLSHALNDGAIELRDIMTIMPLVAGALDYAHKHGVLHRDIKPSNIMLDTDGTPYLTDFGLARAVQIGESSLSQGVLIGTPAYMSPEQGAGEAALDSRSDLYSLGVVLYELVVGRVPFNGTTTYKILHGHQTEMPPLPSSINPDVPPAVEAVLLKALSKDPEERYNSAMGMYMALREALIASGVRRLNTGSRLSIAAALEKSRIEDKSKPLPRSSAARRSANVPRDIIIPPEGRIAADSAPSVRTGVAVAGKLAARGRGDLVADPPSSAQAKPDRVVYILVGMLFVLAAILVGALILNGRNVTAGSTPTSAVNAAAPTATAPRLSLSDGVRLTEEAAVRQPNAANLGAAFTPGALPAGRQQLLSLPADMQPYSVPILTRAEAQARINADPDDPLGYLALMEALLNERSPLLMGGAFDAARAGLEVDSSPSYVATLLEIAIEYPTPPEVLFRLYDELLDRTRALPTGEIVRMRAGAHLYPLLSDAERLPMVVYNNVRGLMDSSFDPLFYALLARAAIAQHQLADAEGYLQVSGTDFAEAHLVQGDLHAARGDLLAARESWSAARADADAPAWVQSQAARLLG
jgi:serine/threonine protein kinase